ncbi:MAG: ion transporter [Pseudomonadota bacterium]|nr:ion transporter [Pseudomonadota bacterium]
MNRQRIMEVVNAAKPDDPVSRMCDVLLSILIILNLVAVCLESVETINQQFRLALLYFEIFSVSIFALEYSLRIWSAADNKKLRGNSALKKRCDYIFSFTGLIDLMAILPSILPLIFGGIDLRWLRILRLVRLLKISHYSSALEDFFSALYEERKSFFATIYLLSVALFLSSSLVYLAENEVQPEEFKSIPHAMWWSLITLTTVGYGDVSPITPVGKIVGAFTALMGVCTVALLTGIVASAFANQLARKRQMFEAEVSNALDDGILTGDEENYLNSLKENHHISDEQARAIINTLSKSRNKKET